MDRNALIDAPRLLWSQRLRLESPEEHHAEAFVESLNRSLPAMAFITWAQQAHDTEWALEFCRRDRSFVSSGQGLVFNAFLREGGAFVGRVDLHTFDFQAPRCEIGYVGDVRQQGRGLMREAALRVLDAGFEMGLARIEAMSDARNGRALHFARSLGMVQEGVLHHHERDPLSALCDMVLFAAYNPAAR